jgi:hypothetical protein
MFSLNISRSNISVLAIVFMMFAVPGYADDVMDSINEAVEFYKNGEFTDAVESLNYASQLIQQKKGKSLESFLPQPLSGWTAEKASSQAAGAAMFGGGIVINRKYRKGSSSITVEIVTDSPLMQGMMMMFSNPMFATSDGGKMERIKRQKAIVKIDSENKTGDIKIVVVNRFLVSIKGNGVTENDLKAYAKAIDYKKMAALP